MIKLKLIMAVVFSSLVLILLNVSTVSSRNRRNESNIPGPMSGSWIIVVPAGSDKARLQLQGQWKNNASVHVPLLQLQGLSTTEVHSNGSSVNFQLVREAGKFTFTGLFRKGTGTGEWIFKGNSAFLDGLTKHGYEHITEEDLYALALSDVGITYIRELELAGYRRLTTTQMVGLYTNNVTTDYIASLESVGYKKLSPNELVALRSNGITAKDASIFSKLVVGNIPAVQLIALESNGVTEAYIRSLQDVGYNQLTAGQLIALRTNGVTRDFIQRLQQRGYERLTVERILSLRNKLPMEF